MSAAVTEAPSGSSRARSSDSTNSRAWISSSREGRVASEMPTYSARLRNIDQKRELPHLPRPCSPNRALGSRNPEEVSRPRAPLSVRIPALKSAGTISV